MFKYIIFALFPLAILGISHPTLAEEQPLAGAAPVKSLPAHDNPVNAESTASTVKESVKNPASKTQHNNEKSVDYRYCLELKTNREITECRYKK